MKAWIYSLKKGKIQIIWSDRTICPTYPQKGNVVIKFPQTKNFIFWRVDNNFYLQGIWSKQKFQPNLQPKLDILDSDFGSSNKKLQGKEKKFWIKKSKSGSRFYRGG